MEDDYERPPYLDMTPMDLAALGDGMAYTDMGDDPATIKALDDADADETFFDALGDAMDDGAAGFPDDDESYANKVNAPLTEAEAHEIGRQIKSGDYPRYKRSTVHNTDRDGATTDVHVTQPVRRRSTGDDDPGWDAYAAAMDGDGADVIATLDAAVADGTAGTTVAPPGFVECANIEGQLWSSIAGDYEPEHAADPMFYIWSNKHQLYWGPNRKGYVAWPSQAGQYTAVEASAIVNHSMRGIILGNNRAVPDSIMLPVPDTIPDGAE